MIVVDASAVVDAVAGEAPSEALFAGLVQDVHAPHLLDVEVTSVLRGLELGRVLAPARADQAREDYWALSIQRHELAPLAHRVWELRHQFPSYDAAYVALAEALDAPLMTCDKKLAVRGHRAEVVLIDRSA